MSRPVDQTGKQHWPHGLSCPLAGLPPILITDRGNRFFIFSFFQTFKVKKLQNRLQPERNQPRFRAVKLYEVRAVLPPIPASFFTARQSAKLARCTPSDRPRQMPCARGQGCKKATASRALPVQQSEICSQKAIYSCEQLLTKLLTETAHNDWQRLRVLHKITRNPQPFRS